MTEEIEDYRAAVREKILSYPDFPKVGVLFHDISPILRDPLALRMALRLHTDLIESTPLQAGDFDHVVGLDARGFLFGILIADRFGVPFTMARKAGKLPGEVCEISYNLEYGSASIQIQKDAIPPGHRVLVVDDLLATGGTARAACDLVRFLAGAEVVAALFFIELRELKGREKIPAPVLSVFQL